MLRNCEKMMDRVVLGNTSPLIVLPYVRAYRAMDCLVHHCFGSNFVSVDVGDLLKEVIISYMELGLSVTLKMHVIFTFFQLSATLSSKAEDFVSCQAKLVNQFTKSSKYFGVSIK